MFKIKIHALFTVEICKLSTSGSNEIQIQKQKRTHCKVKLVLLFNII